MKKKILTLGAVLTLVAVLVVPGAVLATTTDVTGDVIEGYTFTPPPGIGLGSMTPGTPKTGDSAGSLEGNNAAGYTVKAKDDKTPYTGYMTVGTDVLENLLEISSDGTNYMTIDTEKTFLTTSAPGEDAVPLYAKQDVTYSDPVATGYTITITFTVTPNTAP